MKTRSTLFTAVLVLMVSMNLSGQENKAGYVLIKFNEPAPQNLEKFKQYAKMAGAAGKEFGAKTLSAGKAPEIIEGMGDDDKFVLLEFPSKAAAKNWYSSENYSKAKKHRKGIVDLTIILLEGR